MTVLAFDFNVLLDNTESILASLVALATLVTTFLLAIGKVKAANKVKELKETLEKNTKEINEHVDTIKTIVEGVDKVKDIFRPKLEKKQKNAGAIIEEHASTIGTIDLVNKAVEMFGKKT